MAVASMRQRPPASSITSSSNTWPARSASWAQCCRCSKGGARHFVGVPHQGHQGRLAAAQSLGTQPHDRAVGVEGMAEGRGAGHAPLDQSRLDLFVHEAAQPVADSQPVAGIVGDKAAEQVFCIRSGEAEHLAEAQGASTCRKRRKTRPVTTPSVHGPADRWGRAGRSRCTAARACAAGSSASGLPADARGALVAEFSQAVSYRPVTTPPRRPRCRWRRWLRSSDGLPGPRASPAQGC